MSINLIQKNKIQSCIETLLFFPRCIGKLEVLRKNEQGVCKGTTRVYKEYVVCSKLGEHVMYGS